MEFKDLQKMVYETNKKNGWHDNEADKPASEYLINIVGEVSEAWESRRNRELDIWTRENGKPEGMWTELADTVIRIMDFAEAYSVDLENLIVRKDAYNKTRGYRHGNKRY